MGSADLAPETRRDPLEEGTDFALFFCFVELDRRDMASSATCDMALHNFKCRLNTSSEYGCSPEAEPAAREIPASGSANDSSCAGQECFRLPRNPLSCSVRKAAPSPSHVIREIPDVSINLKVSHLFRRFHPALHRRPACDHWTQPSS